MSVETIRARMRRAPVAVVAVSTALTLAACGADGGDPGAAGGGAQPKFEQAALKFTRCMREQGVDMPDPKRGARGFTITPESDPSQGNSDRFRRANAACQHHMKGVQPPKLSEEEHGEFREAALKHARCMRKNGINMPDPRVDRGNAVAIELPAGIRPDDPRFERASAACRKASPLPLPGGPGS